MLTRSVFVAWMALVAAAVQSDASPGAKVKPVLQPVSAEGLDLRVAAGRAALRHRVRAAAHALCDGVQPAGAADACYARAFDDGWWRAQMRIATDLRQARGAGL